jgi:PKD repeat protein
VYFCDRDNSSIRKGSKFVNSSSGTIFSTYAGKSDWTGGYVDGKLTDARFRFPEDAQYDDSGILYICDFMNHCIRKISGGNVTTLAGDGSQSAGYTDATGKSARFSFPSGIGMDTNGDLLVADRNNRCIRRINTQTAAVTTVTKDVNFPYDVIGVNGKIYILEPTCIKVFDGKTVKVFAGSTSNSGYKDGSIQEARFGQMFHFDYNPIDQCLYVADYGNNVIRRIPLNLEVTSDFVANNTNPIVNQTVVLSSKAQNQESQTWEITPSSYVLQAGSKLTDRIVYVSFSNAASYSVKLTAKNPSGQAVASKENYINVSTNSLAKPVADFTVTNTYPTLTVETVRLVDLSANNPTSFEWTITPNTFTFQNSTNAQSRNPEVKFNALGLYTLSLNVQNTNGSDVETKTNFIKVVGLNTQTQQTRNVYVYPNPSNGQVFIKGLSIGSQIQVLDMNGRLILSQESNSESISLELTQGIYFIQAYSEGTWQSLGKVIITPY